MFWAQQRHNLNFSQTPCSKRDHFKKAEKSIFSHRRKRIFFAQKAYESIYFLNPYDILHSKMQKKKFRFFQVYFPFKLLRNY